MGVYKKGQEVLHNGEYYRIAQIITFLGKNKTILRLRRFDNNKEIVIDVPESLLNVKKPRARRIKSSATKFSIYDLLNGETQ